MLDPEFKTKWVAALRSGKYTQGREWLCADGKFCCLGVACDVIDPSLWGQSTFDPGVKVHEGSVCAIPIELRSRVGLSAVEECELMHFNDRPENPLTFSQIADYIEKNL